MSLTSKNSQSVNKSLANSVSLNEIQELLLDNTG